MNEYKFKQISDQITRKLKLAINDKIANKKLENMSSTLVKQWLNFLDEQSYIVYKNELFLAFDKYRSTYVPQDYKKPVLKNYNITVREKYTPASLNEWKEFNNESRRREQKISYLMGGAFGFHLIKKYWWVITLIIAIIIIIVIIIFLVNNKSYEGIDTGNPHSKKPSSDNTSFDEWMMKALG